MDATEKSWLIADRVQRRSESRSGYLAAIFALYSVFSVIQIVIAWPHAGWHALTRNGIMPLFLIYEIFRLWQRSFKRAIKYQLSDVQAGVVLRLRRQNVIFNMLYALAMWPIIYQWLYDSGYIGEPSQKGSILVSMILALAMLLILVRLLGRRRTVLELSQQGLKISPALDGQITWDEIAAVDLDRSLFGNSVILQFRRPQQLHAFWFPWLGFFKRPAVLQKTFKFSCADIGQDARLITKAIHDRLIIYGTF